MVDSLILGNSIELLGGGVASVNPLCPGAKFRLQPSYDLSAPQPTSDFVASLLLDGERPYGRRASNRLIKLPVWVTAPNRQILAAAREVLEQTIDQDIWTMTWSRDPSPGATPLPLIFDCFRAQATVPTYSIITEKDLLGFQIGLTIPALPYGRADIQTQVSFAAPVPASPPPPPPPVTIDSFSSISSAQCTQSNQCVVGPRSCCWDPDFFGDFGGQTNRFFYPAQLATTLNLTGMVSLQMWLGFGSRYYTWLEYHGKVSGVGVSVTLIDSSGNTLSFSRTNLRLACSPIAQQPVFSRITMPIPASATFNFASVVGYSIEVINRSDRIRRLSWVTCYVDNLAAYPPSQTVNPVTRGALYTLYGLQGTARAAATLSFQQVPTPGTPTVITTAGVGNYTVPSNTAYLKVEGVGAGGAGASLTGTGVGGGGGGGAYSRENVFPASPGDLIPYSIGVGGIPGSTEVDGQPTVFGPDPAGGTLALTAPGGFSALQNSPTGGLGAPVSGNAVSFPGGQGRTASGNVGGGGGSSGGSTAGGLTPTGTGSTLFTSTGTTPWTCPQGVFQVYAECWAAGGSGACGSSSGNGGAGGGGEYAAGYINVTPGTVYNVVVPPGAAAVVSTAANGLAGALASFTGDAGASIVAHGGGGGLYETNRGGSGTAGTGSTATVHNNGGTGGQAFPYAGSGGSSAGPAAAGNAGSGYGGTTPAPTGGGAGGASSGASSNPGTAGSQPGGGGGGTYAGGVSSGAGGAGQVRLNFPAGTGAPTPNGAGAVPGGGAGGNGGATANTAGSAGSQPGGGGGGADSTGTAESGGAGGNGKLTITPYSSAPFKSLIVHRPPIGAIKTFQPLIPVGGGTDVPDGTHQYAIPQPVSGINADFGGTYTIYLVASSFSGSGNRSVFVTVTQYEYAGGPSYTVSTLPVTFTPAQITNGIVTAGVLTLPMKNVAADNSAGYYSVSVTSTNTSDRYLDCIALDTMGQTVVISESSTGYITYYLDAPEPNLNLGLIMGSQAGRPSAISVFDACQSISGGAIAVEPADGENQLFAYCADAQAPNIALSYYPNYFFDRTQ
jgi:hypothetical protein